MFGPINCQSVREAQPWNNDVQTQTFNNTPSTTFANNDALVLPTPTCSNRNGA